MPIEPANAAYHAGRFATLRRRADMKKCAYCDAVDLKLTSEHVVSKSFLKKHHSDGIGFAKCYDKYTHNNLTINDVCANCNNAILSRLDDYFLNFYNQIDQSISISKETYLEIEYNYELLSKWLLKTLYNSERKNNYEQLPKKLNRFKNYITGKDKRTRLFDIYIELLSDISLSIAEKYFPDQIINNTVKLPFLKFGTCIGNDQIHSKNPRIIKHFISNNLVFYVFIYNPKELKISEKKEYLKNFTENGKLYIHRVDPNKTKLRLSASSRNIADIVSRTFEGSISAIDRYIKEFA